MASVMEPPSRSRHDDVDLDRDRALVERCQAGDPRAFEDLYLRYRDRLYRSCLRRTGNAAEAEDLVQETFARAWKALPRFNGERRLYPWLSVIANNLCTDLARRGGRCTPVEESDLDLIAPVEPCEQDRLVESHGDGQILAAALGRISPRHREVLELREGRNWSYQEIAAHSGVEVSTIETLLFRARRSLKREFLTLTRAETGLAGVIAFPLVAMRGLWRRARRLAGHTPGAAKLAGFSSSLPGSAIAGGAAVAITAAALTAGALTGAHPSTSTTASSSRLTAGLFAHAAGTSGAAGKTNAATGPAARRPGQKTTDRHGAGTGPRHVAHGRRTGAGHASSASGHTAVGGIGSTVGGLGGSLGSSNLGGVGQTVHHGFGTVHKTVKHLKKDVKKTVKGVVGGVSGGVSSVSGGVSGGVSSILGGLS